VHVGVESVNCFSCLSCVPGTGGQYCNRRLMLQRRVNCRGAETRQRRATVHRAVREPAVHSGAHCTLHEAMRACSSVHFRVYTFFVMLFSQVHYTNPEGLSTIQDHSGMYLRLSPTLRKYDAGWLELAPESTKLLQIPPGQVREDSHTVTQ